MWTKFKTTTGMTMDSLAGRDGKDVVMSGTAFWISELLSPNKFGKKFIETREIT